MVAAVLEAEGNGVVAMLEAGGGSLEVAALEGKVGVVGRETTKRGWARVRRDNYASPDPWNHVLSPEDLRVGWFDQFSSIGIFCCRPRAVIC